MNNNTLKEAIEEAKRFIKAAEKIELKQSQFNKSIWYPVCNKTTAAAKRASMDLTRKLADLRQGR